MNDLTILAYMLLQAVVLVAFVVLIVMLAIAFVG